MTRVVFAFLFLITISSSVNANEADEAFMKKAIIALQTQRNAATDAQATAEAKLAVVLDELKKSEDKVKELTDKLKPPEAPEGKHD